MQPPSSWCSRRAPREGSRTTRSPCSPGSLGPFPFCRSARSTRGSLLRRSVWSTSVSGWGCFDMYVFSSILIPLASTYYFYRRTNCITPECELRRGAGLVTLLRVRIAPSVSRRHRFQADATTTGGQLQSDHREATPATATTHAASSAADR